VIFVTARNEDEDEERGLEMGAVDYIRKPFSMPSVRTRIKTHLDLKREQERSENLLLNILPAPIAARLKAGEINIADGFSEASILFADIVGFTKMASQISPKQLVVILNALFSRFDELTERFGVEKIKTIGDAYMVSAGVPVLRPDHAEATAEMAFAMQVALTEHNREFGSDMQLRIGIASGPVDAGVIGLKRFIYDLWGDTVNLASRMESHGIPGSIQVSAQTRSLLQDRYILAPRGEIEIKGLGPVPAWLLTGRIGDNVP
jgi:class 3 adenylate cyclase